MTTHECTLFRAALEAVMDLPDVGFPLERAKHLNGCEGCQEWLDELDFGDASDETLGRRLGPLMEALAQLEAELQPSPTQVALAEAREADERRVDEAVRAFIDRHPHLAPAAYGIDMTRFEHAAFFSALHGVNMLIRRIARRGEEEPSTYGLREDGAVLVGENVRVPASSVRAEIGRSIVQHRIVPEEEKTPDLGEALRREAAWRDDETCAKLAKWIVEAMRVKPDIMRNYRVVGTEGGDTLLLEPIRTTTGERDAVELWNVRPRR